MRKLTRILRVVATFAGIYSVAIVIAMGWPATLWIALAIGFSLLGRRGAKVWTTLGSARFATMKEIEKAGMLSGKPGLIIGREKRRFGGGRLIRLCNAVHTVVYGATGKGKNSSLIFPWLLTCPDSPVVIDPKGESAKLTAEYRRKVMGHTIALVDPYKIVTQKPDTYNPLDEISKDSRVAIDDCRDLAASIVVRTGQEHERHFDDVAQAGIAGICAVVVARGEKDKGTRNIQTVYEIINSAEKEAAAISLMEQLDDWDRALVPVAGQLRYLQDREKGSVKSTQSRHMSVFGTPTIRDSTMTSSFDPNELRKGKMTIYLIMPPDRMAAGAGLMRMWVSSLVRVCMRGGLEQ